MPGESLYSHFLTPDANVVDDTLVYRRGWQNYLVVVNASNDDKDRTWLESVRDGKVCIDNARPWARTFGYEAVIRNLRDPKSGDDMRVDIALQGPKSRRYPAGDGRGLGDTDPHHEVEAHRVMRCAWSAALI